MAQRSEHYSLDEQGLLVESVGPWAVDKLKIVTDYIQASSAARRRYLGSGAAYIDVFCGPGRSKICTTGKTIDGSPVAAFKKAGASLAPFTVMHISDADPELLSSGETRLIKLKAPVRVTPGPASSAMPKIVQQLNVLGLHFAFLDPHNLGALSFDLFESLANSRELTSLFMSVSRIYGGMRIDTHRQHTTNLIGLLPVGEITFGLTSTKGHCAPRSFNIGPLKSRRWGYQGPRIVNSSLPHKINNSIG